MAHGAAQIHAALVTALTGLTTTSTRVYDDETTAINVDAGAALRVLDDGEEQIEYVTQKPPRTLYRHITYSVHILCKAANAKSTLNTSLAEVEAVLYTNRTLGGIARDVRPERIDKSYSDELDKRVGQAVITVAVDWVSVEGTPNTPT